MKQYRTLILIIVILAAAIYIDLPFNPKFGSNSREITTHLGLDLVGGVQALLEADVAPGQTVDSISMDTARKIIESRVNGLGVSEAVVQRAGSTRIVVEIPGVQDPEQAITSIKTTGLLEFVDMSMLSQQEAIQMMNSNAIIKTDVNPTGATQPVTSTVNTTQPITATEQVYHTVMTGDKIKEVGVVLGQLGEFEVSFVLTSEGGEIFADFTKAHVSQVLAIILDKKIISAPTINSAITEGRGVIQGSFTQDSANNLADLLRYGSLPIPLKVSEIRTVGPTLGQDSLFFSLRAGIIGFCIVILFMGIYYRLPGLVADISILTYAVITFALFRGIPVTLTLPGIAGLMLSTGSALDANILIFERMKEELRAGKSLEQAISQGWKHAWPSIRDSNIATIITCGILYYFGSAFGATIVKGFSLTLALGVGVSLFTAIVVTRTFLTMVVTYLKPANLTRWFGI